MNKICMRSCAPALRLFLSLFVFGLLFPEANAQQNTNLTVKIPILKDRRYYNYTSEDGRGRNCGVQLFAVWDVFKNYTNLNSYRYSLTGIQNPGAARLIVDGQKKTFQVYCYFNGRSGPDGPNVNCDYTIGPDLPEWEATLTRTPPRANFTTTLFPSTPGEVRFQATSIDPEDPEGNLLTHTWDFADSSTASGDIQVHQYTKPGRFNVRLTATNPDGLVGSAVREVRIAAPRPIVSMQLFNKHSQNRIEPAEEFRVRVTVEASADGVGSLTNLYFNGPLLAVPDIFTVLSAPAQTNIGNLQPGQKKEFDWTLRTVGIGNFTLASASVSGRDEAGQIVFGSGSTQRGEVTALIVGIQQRPKKMLLNHDNNGDGKTNSLDNRVEIIVSVTNVINLDITDVQTTVTNDPIKLISLASTPNINMIVTNTVPGVFGTIPSGESRSITNTYEAWGRVYAEAQSVVHGKVDGVPVEEAGKGTINVGGDTLLELRLAVREDTHESGKPIRIYGSITNVSLLKSREGNVVDEGKTVGVVVYSFPEGNGIGGFLSDARSGGETPRAPTAFLLKPGESIDVSAILPTAEIPTNTWVFLNYEAQGFVHEKGGKREAFPDEIKFVEESIGDNVNQRFSASHRVELPPAPEIVDPWDECSLDFPTDAYYSCRVRNGLGTLFGGPRDLIMLAGTGLWEIGKGTLRMSAYFLWTEEQRIKALLGDEKARERLATQIDLDWQALRAVGADILPDSTTPGTILSSVESALSKFANRKGGFRYWAGGALEFLVENADMVGEGWIAARTYRELSREAGEAAAKKAQQEYFQKQADELAGNVEEFAAKRSLSELPKSGLMGFGLDVIKHPRVWRDAYGATEREIKALLEIARKEGVIIAFRSRSPRAAELIEKGLALLKPHGVSIKTVTELDFYLGFPRKFEGLCVLMDPPFPWVPAGGTRQQLMKSYLKDRFPALAEDEDLYAQVLKRFDERMDEFPKEWENFKIYRESGTIDVGFATQKQFGNNPLFKDVIVNKSNFRKAEEIVEDVEGALPGDIVRKARVITMETAPGSGKFLPITGDIDLLGIFNLDGTAPGLFKRLRLYEHLRRAGIQHGESFTFYKKEARELFLKCCSSVAEKAETMLAATPYGQLLTTQFNEGLSVLPGGVNAALQVGKHVEDNFTYLSGVMTEAFSKERPSIGEYFEALRYDVAPQVTVSAVAKMVEDEDAEIDRKNGLALRVGADGLPEIYTLPGSSPSGVNAPRILSRTGTGRLLRQQNSTSDDSDTILAKLIAAGYVPKPADPGALGGAWHKATAEEVKAAQAGPTVKLAPYTYLYDDIPEGSTLLPVFSAAELGVKPRSQFFSVGDRIVIDPGGPNEETAILVSVSPLTVSHPLASAKYVGTTVLFLSGLDDDGKLPGALPALDNLLVWLRADAGLTLTNGTNVASWTDQSRNGFVFASPSEGARPTLVVNPATGLAALRFDPVKRNQLNGQLGQTLSNATIFTVVRLNPQTSSRYLYSFGTRNTSGYMMTLGRRSGDFYHYDGAAESASSGIAANTNFMVLSQTYGGGGPDHHRLDLNGKTVIDSGTTTGRPYSATTEDVVLGNYLSATYHFAGDLMEWMVYNRTLTETEKSQVAEYLRRRAGLPSFPAVTHVSLSSIGFGVGSPDRTTARWTYDSGGDVFSADGGVAPSVNLLDQAFTGEEVHTRLSVTGTNGAMGLLFGYQNRANFYLLDWRAISKTNSTGQVAPAGLRLIDFHMPPAVEAPGFNDFYASTNSLNTTVLITNELTWIPDRVYDVFLRPSSSGLSIEILDGDTKVLAWLLPDWTDPVGWFGHYSHGTEAAEFGPATIGAAAVEEPIRLIIARGTANGQWTLQWGGGPGSFLLERTTDLGSSSWQAVGAAESSPSRTISADGKGGFFRVRRITTP